MAKGRTVGEAVIRVAPDATQFQSKLLREVKKLDKEKKPQISIPVEADVSEAERDLKHLSEVADVLNNRTITIEAILDTKRFDAELKKLESQLKDRKVDVAIEANVDKKSIGRANRDLEVFREENNTMDTHLFMHTDRAQDSFDRFQKRVAKSIISPRVEIENMKLNPNAGVQMGRTLSKAVGREWTATSFIPDLLSKMNEQFDEGINQIYTPYLRMVADAYKSITKPLIDLKGMAKDAKTLGGLFKALKKQTEAWGVAAYEARFDHVIAMAQISANASELKKKFGELNQAIKGIKAPPGLVNLFTKSRTEMKKYLDSTKEILGGMPKLLQTNMQKALGGARVEAITFFSDMQKYFPGLADSISKPFKQVSEAFKWISFDAKRIMKPIKEEFQAIGIFAGKVMDSISASADGMRSKFSRAWSRISDYSRGSVDRMNSGMNRFFVNTQRRLGTMVTGARTGFAGFGASAKRAFGDMGLDKVAKSAGTAFSGLGKMLGQALDNPVIYSGIKRAFSRISDYAAGATRMAIGSFSKLSGFLLQALVPAVMAVGAGIMAMAGQAAIGAVLALGGAIMSVAQGAALLAPAFMAAAGVSFAALKMGLADVKTAVGSAFSIDDVAEFETSISELAPEVQSIARAFREFKPAMDEMKEAVQGNMLQGLAPGISSAMNNLLPTFSSGLQSIATEWNGAFSKALEELSSDRAQAGLSAVIEGTVAMSREMQPVIANLIGAAGSLAEQGAKFLEPLGKYFAEASESFLNWAESLKELNEATGMSKFDTMIESARVNAGHLAGIFGGLLGTLRNLFQAGAEGGGGMLEGMSSGMQRLNELTKEGTEGYKEIVRFMETATLMGQALTHAFEPALGIVTTIGTTLTGLGAGGLPGIVAVLEGLEAGLQPIMNASVEFGKNIGDGLLPFKDTLESLGGALTPILLGLSQGLKPVLESLAGALTPLFDKITEYGPEIQSMFSTLGEALGKIFSSAGPILESSFDMIGRFLPVLSKVFYYIGEVGKALLDALLPILAGHDNFLISLADQLMEVVDIIGGFLVGAINAVAPLIPPIVEFIFNLLEFFTPLLPLVTKAAIGLGVLIGVVIGLFKAFNFVSGAIKVVQIAWGIMSALFAMSPIGFIITLVVALGVALWAFFTKTETGRQLWAKFTEALKDGWNSFKDVVGQGWNWLMDNVWNPFRDAMGNLGSWFSDKISEMKQSWQDLKDTFSRLWNEIKTGVIETFEQALDGLKSKVGEVVAGIKTIWDGLKQIFRDPIEFYVNTVINKGIIGGWNWVDDKLGGKMGHIDPISIPGITNSFARGGVMPGYTPGRDVHQFVSPTGGVLNLSGGEAIMRPEWTRAVGGPGAVEEMNRKARNGNLSPVQHHSHALGGVMSFANGGVIEAMMGVVREKYPMLQMTSGYRPGDGGMHGSGLATDWSNGSGNTAAQLALAQDLAATYPGSAELIYDSPGWSGNIKNGSNVGAFGQFYTMAQAGPHHHHVHWAMNTPPTMPLGGGVFEGGSDGGGVMGTIFNAARSLAKSAIGKIFDPISSQFGKFGEGWGNVLPALGGKAFDAATNFFLDKFGPETMAGGSVDTSGVNGTNLEIGEELAARVGWTGSEWQALKELWTLESQWDNNAQNPSSTAYGIAQFLDSTWAGVGYSKTSDPATQIAAGIKYIQGRPDYGVPSKALALWWSRNPHWYDQGGESRGTGFLAKNVIAPERVLSPAQTEAFNDFVYRFMPQLIAQAKAEPTNLRKLFGMLNEQFEATQRLLAEAREVRITGLSKKVESRFLDQINGTKELRPIDFEGLSRIDPRDLESLKGWVNSNSANLRQNLQGAVDNVSEVLQDPHGYLEAEKRAKEALDKAEEEAKSKSDDEAKEKQAEIDKAEAEAQKEREKAEDEAAETDEQKEALKAAREEAKKAKDETEAAEKDKQSEIDKAEADRIAKLKESGEYYYGYKVFGDDGTNPNAREKSTERNLAESALSDVTGRIGLGSLADSILSKVSMVESIGQGVETAMPAWLAAANGDYSGLNHNAAVAGAMVLDSAQEEARNIIPTLAGDLFEAFVAGGTQVPMYGSFIENVYTGMSKSEFNAAIEEYQAKAARKGGGTIRR